MHTHTCMHTYMYTYIAYIHAYIKTYIHCIHKYMHIYIHTHMHTYIHTHMHAYIHTYIHSFIHSYTRKCVRTYVCACVHMYVRTYALTHAFICVDYVSEAALWDTQWTLTFKRLADVHILYFLAKLDSSDGTEADTTMTTHIYIYDNANDATCFLASQPTFLPLRDVTECSRMLPRECNVHI